MPNTENINKVIAFLEQEHNRFQFDMDLWTEADSCGTTACIGGTCELIMRVEEDGPVDYLSVDKMLDIASSVNYEEMDHQEIANWLGIDKDVVYNLFFTGVSMDLIGRDRKRAIEALKCLRDNPDTRPNTLLGWMREKWDRC